MEVRKQSFISIVRELDARLPFLWPNKADKVISTYNYYCKGSQYAVYNKMKINSAYAWRFSLLLSMVKKDHPQHAEVIEEFIQRMTPFRRK